MKKIFAFLIVIFTISSVFAANNDVLKFKGKIGFPNEEDKIVEYKFFENDQKVLIIGLENIQIWDVGSQKLLHSVKHQIPQFAPRGFVSTYLLLGLPKLLDWRPFLVDPNGKWIITSEKTGANTLRSAVVRQLSDLKQIAVLDTPDVSAEYVSYYPPKNEILTFGITEKKAAMASWDIEKFTKKELIYVDNYKWHQTIRDDQKMLVGSGDSKILWTGLNIKQGDTLTLRDVKTGAIEKEYTAKDLKPDTPYQETTVSDDEKYLISKRNNRVFVWEIDGDGQPKFEISAPTPKNDFSFKYIIDRRYVVVEIDESVLVYDIYGDGKPLLKVVPNPKKGADFLQIVNNRYVAIHSEENVRIYDTQGGQTLKYEISSAKPKDRTEYWGASPDGRYFAVKDDNRAAIYEFAGDGKPLYEILRDSEKERFYTIQFVQEKDLFAVSRVNNSEKKAPRTEFYNLSNGKVAFETPIALSGKLKTTPNDTYYYEDSVGAFNVWNLKTKKVLSIGLETQQEEIYDTSNQTTTYGNYYNTEFAEFSPDYRYILRHGNKITAVYETASGQEVQKLFDPERAQYDKKTKALKRSGYGTANWTQDSKYIYALDGVGLFGTRRTISFWEVTK